jgi:hypothetical protein
MAIAPHCSHELHIVRARPGPEEHAMRSFGSWVQFVLDDAREKGEDDGAGRAPMVLEACAEHAAADEADGLGRRRREHAVAGELRAERDYMLLVSAV